MICGAAGLSRGSPGTRTKQVPSLIAPSPLVCPQGDRVEIYRELESVLQGDDGRLPGGIVNRLIAEASSDMRAAQVSLFSSKATKAACLRPWVLGKYRAAQRCSSVIPTKLGSAQGCSSWLDEEPWAPSSPMERPHGGGSGVCDSLFPASPQRGRGGSSTGLCRGEVSLVSLRCCSPAPGYKRQRTPWPEHNCSKGTCTGDRGVQPVRVPQPFPQEC